MKGGRDAKSVPKLETMEVPASEYEAMRQVINAAHAVTLARSAATQKSPEMRARFWFDCWADKELRAALSELEAQQREASLWWAHRRMGHIP